MCGFTVRILIRILDFFLLLRLSQDDASDEL